MSAATPDMKPHGERGLLEKLLTAKGLTLAWLAYVLANALSRYMLSHTLATDDAPASLLAQNFHLGYVLKHPPLWEWLLWSIQQVTGPGIESHLLLRYGCIFLLGIGVFRASRVVSGDIRWSAALALCLPLFYQMGWPFFDWGTHTLILVVICLFTMEIALRYVAMPTIRLAALLGLFVGLGFLAKYGFAIFLLALFLALVVQPRGRAALLRREILIVPLVAVIVLSPLLYWIIETRGDLIAMTQGNLIRSSAPHFERVTEGLVTFTKSSLNFLMPWLPIAAFSVWYGRRSDSARMAPMEAGEHSAGLTLFFSLALTIAGVLAFGVDKITNGYIVPVLVAALPYSAALLSRAAPGVVGARRIAVLGVTVLLIVTLTRTVYLSNSGFPERTYRRDMTPYAGLADEIRKAGLDRGTFVALSVMDGGNLRAELPHARVVTNNHRDLYRPSFEPGQGDICHLIWNESAVLAPGERWARSSDGKKARAMPEVRGREFRSFDIPWPWSYLGNARTSRWTMVELDPDDPLCR